MDRPGVVHAHAAVFTGWLVLFIAQTVLAATGRIRAHLRLGRIGAWHGAGLIVLGVYTAIVRSAALPVGEREMLLWVTLVDMAVFSGLFGAALWCQRRPQEHKRLMTAAAVSLAIAAVARMEFLPAPPMRQFVAFFLWSAPILIAIAYDARHASSRFHPAYVVALVLFAIRMWSPLVIVATPRWTEFTAMVLGQVGTWRGSSESALSSCEKDDVGPLSFVTDRMGDHTKALGSAVKAALPANAERAQAHGEIGPALFTASPDPSS